MDLRTFLSAAALMAVLPGCATITSSEVQTLTLSAKNEQGQAIEKADCMLRNDKGTWQAQTPGTVAVRRSSEDLIVECKKEGSPDGILRAISRAAAGMFGNIIFGGGIGAIIDHTKGTGYNYPDDLPVKMGSTLTVDRQDQTNAQEEKTASSATPAK